MTRAFISHRSTDKAVFRRLATAFARAGVQVWDYLDEARDTLGGPLLRELRELVSSEFVVVIVSDDSIANPHVAVEVEAALARGFGERHRLFVVVRAGTSPRSTWRPPFDELGATVAGFDVATDRDVDDQAAEILGAVALQHVPGPADPRRLPLLVRTLTELDGAPADVRERMARRSQGQFNRVVRGLEDAATAYEQEQYGVCAGELESVCGQLASFARGFEPYYLRIGLAVCALHDDAPETAHRHLQRCATHPLRDESWWGAMGHVHVRGGDLLAARAAYAEAVRICRTRQVDDLAASASARAIDLLLGATIDELPIALLDDAPERLTVAAIVAAGRIRRGDAVGAVDALREFPLAAHDARSLSVLVEALEESGDVDAARWVLEVWLMPNGAPDPRTTAMEHAVLWRSLARARVATGHLDDALAIYRDVLCGPLMAAHPQLAVHLVEHARLCRLHHDRGGMRRVCERLMSIPPRDELGCYCRGFAAHLLGNAVVAADMFTASKGYGRAYELVLAGDGAVAGQ